MKDFFEQFKEQGMQGNILLGMRVSECLKTIEIARKMLEHGVNLEIIKKCTGLLEKTLNSSVRSLCA